MFVLESPLCRLGSPLRGTLKTIVLVTLILVHATLSQGVLCRPVPSQTGSGAASISHGPTNPEELKDSIDQFFINAMREDHIPGAVFIMVKDGKTFFSKGYGYADTKTPVNPDKTLFRVASISKLFTATAVMQLVEEGKIDLNEDINKYLTRFQIEYRTARPITVADLLMHTDGFDIQWNIGRFARSQSELKPLGEFLAERLPEQVEQPGSLYLYSDVGMTLAGYLVEEVSGSPFSQYVEERILKPLEMRNSTFEQPLPSKLKNDLAVGFYKDGNSLWSTPFLYFNSSPAGALSCTATDIGHFMIAHLQNGKYGYVPILREETAKDMHRRRFEYISTLFGVAYGFHVSDDYPRTLYQGGEAPGFSSMLVLLPDEGMGYFVALNIENQEFISKLTTRLLNHYYPAPEGPDKTQSTPGIQEGRTTLLDSQLERFAGVYRYDQYPRHTIDKIGLLFQRWFIDQRVEVGNDGTLIVFPEGTKWQQVEPFVFRQVDGKERLVFGENNRGDITELFKDGDILRYERLAWYETIPFQKGLIGFFALTFFTAPAVGLSGYLIDLSRRRKGRPLRQQSSQPKVVTATKYLAIAVSVLHLCFMIGLLLFLRETGIYTLIWGLPADLKALLMIPPVSALMTIPLAFLILVCWKKKSCPTVARVYYSATTLAAFAFLFFLSRWNLLGF